MNRKKLRMAFVLIALVLTGTVFSSAFLSAMNGNQVQESILFDLNMGLAADDYVVHDPILIMSDSDFASQGWPGSGTPEDPYLIEGLSIDSAGDECIWIWNTQVYFIIRDCLLYGAQQHSGIRLSTTIHGQLVNNTCTQNNCGISLSECSNSTLLDNRCSANVGGISLDWSDNCTLTGNICSDNDGDGISVLQSNHVVLLNNICNENGDGIVVEGWNVFLHDCVLVNNTCNNNYGNGVELYLCKSSIAMNNTITENYCGINLEDCTDISVIWNVLNNSYNAEDSNGLNFFDHNYWSDYDGNDADGDGIGDTPYEIEGGSVDNHPLMYPPGSEPTTTTTTDDDDQPVPDVIVGVVIAAAACIIIVIVLVQRRRKTE